MEDGLLWSENSIGEHAMSKTERCGWMAGAEMEYKQIGAWIFKTHIAANPRRTLSASRCTSCGLVDLYAK